MQNKFLCGQKSSFLSWAFAGALLTIITISSSALAQNEHPLPVPKNVRVSSSAPKAEVWDRLTSKQKQLATHLFKASEYGRTLVYYQSHRHALALKTVIETALGSKKNQSKTREILGEDGYQEFLNYAAKFEDLCGPYEVSNRKYVLTLVSDALVKKLIVTYQPEIAEPALTEISRLLVDPTYEVTQYPDETGENLEHAGGNLYEKGITHAEVEAALKKGLKPDLNCRVARNQAGDLYCQWQTAQSTNADPVVPKALKKVVKELKKALPFALTAHQSKQIRLLINYLEKGTIEDFRQFNVEWVQDGTDSVVDFMMGYVEVYQDYRGAIGSWESYVQIIDPKTTAISTKLATLAQDFEKQMPYPEQYKKVFDPNRKAPALMAHYFQEISSFHSGGYNLPNYDDIRTSIGFKNIIRQSFPGEGQDPAIAKLRKEAYQEFVPANRVNAVLTHVDQAWDTIVLLHEIIGHGSGSYNEKKYGEKVDPVGALGSLGSALEELRADLAALTFADHENMIKAGVYADVAEANAVRDVLYDYYAADLLLRLSRQRSFDEAHQKGHWLFVNKLLEAGAIRFASQDGSEYAKPENAVLQVTNYDLFQTTARTVLEELQNIKAERDEEGLKQIFAVYAPSIKELTQNTNKKAPAWQHAHLLKIIQAVIQRGTRLAINSGSIEQPWKITRHVGVPRWVPYFGQPQFKTLGDLTIESAALYWRK